MIQSFNHLNAMGYRDTSRCKNSCPTKSDEVIPLHIYHVENGNEDQLVTISIFISTGRIMIQGKKFDVWSRDEFPTLLFIVNNLEPSSQNPLMFVMALPKLFPKCQGTETNNEKINNITDEEDVVRDNEISDVTETPNVNRGTKETLHMSEHIEPLSLTPCRLNTLVTLNATFKKKDAIHGRVQQRPPQNHPTSPQGPRPLLHHTPHSNATKNWRV